MRTRLMLYGCKQSRIRATECIIPSLLCTSSLTLLSAAGLPQHGYRHLQFRIQTVSHPFLFLFLFICSMIAHSFGCSYGPREMGRNLRRSTNSGRGHPRGHSQLHCRSQCHHQFQQGLWSNARLAGTVFPGYGREQGFEV